jgi:coproporphyrinogen III oxidase-like Fe-S oxidoreductase
MMNISKNMVDLFNQLFVIENNWANVFYMHTPFCIQRCHYCVYSSRVPSSGQELEAFYSRILPRQIERYKPILDNITFDQAYFGGGTPTIVTADKLEGIYKQVPNFKDIPVKTTEISPYTVKDEHIDLFRRYGFIYVSMGVQTFNHKVLRKENRLIVTTEKLTDICQQLDKYNIISNVDLIFYLDTGDLPDLAISRGDLEILMSLIRPVSMTLHFNYRLTKSLEKRRAMMMLIKEMLEKYPEYQCVNSLLEETDLQFDMENSAEYRLMRKQENFNFYMLPKVPKTYPFGHNVLAVGEYMEVKPWSNYYYIYNLRDKYLWRDYYNLSKIACRDFEKTREKLELPHHNFIKNSSFFTGEQGKEKFKTILKQTGNPYYELY